MRRRAARSQAGTKTAWQTGGVVYRNGRAEHAPEVRDHKPDRNSTAIFRDGVDCCHSITPVVISVGTPPKGRATPVIDEQIEAGPLEASRKGGKITAETNQRIGFGILFGPPGNTRMPALPTHDDQ